MSEHKSLDKKVTSFVFGLVAAFGFTHARKFVARRYGEDSEIYRLLEEKFPQLARELHDHIVDNVVEQVAPAPKAIAGGDGGAEQFGRGIRAYSAKDWNKAYVSFLAADKAGHPEAALFLGFIYREERITLAKTAADTHLQLALGQFEKAIAAGDVTNAPLHVTGIGMEYQPGGCVPRDDVKAHKCFSIAAKAGNQQGMCRLAQTYLQGCGTAKDRQAARYWIGRAAACVATDEEREIAALARQSLAEMDAEERQQRERDGGSSGGRMTRSQALEILELEEGATPAQMRASYLRLVQINHPDKGGSTYFMKQLNAAREVLGF
jgi:hypothetical protein